MKKMSILLYLCMWIVPLWGQSIQRTAQGIKVRTENNCVEISCYSSSIVRVMKYPEGKLPEKQSLAVVKEPEKLKLNYKKEGEKLILSTALITVTFDVSSNQISFTDNKGRLLVSEKPFSTLFTPTDDAGDKTWRVSQTFLLDTDETIYGLGQHQGGMMNQRNQKRLLRHENMEICIPLIHSIKGYALYWDNYSQTDFIDNEAGMTFDSAVGDLSDYYFVYGGSADKVVAQLRDLTGQAPLFPLWTFGYWQSKERYASQDELVSVVEKYRDLNVPLDGIIQDWRYWGDDHKNWNAIEFRSPKFPNPKHMLEQVHRLNAHAIISVWPSFGPATKPYADFKQQGLLMAHETFPQDNGVRVYNAYNPVARNIFWKHLNKTMFSIGMDGWWLDATEPEHNPIKEEDYDYQTGQGSFRKLRNAFPLVSVGGVYEQQREMTSDKRVFILTRSAYAGQQRYATHCWSGDVFGNWQVLHDQISSALNLSLCGIPYWNSDIGGFYSANNFPKGVEDPAYQELYVRWMQFAVFTGMMRSHGTNTPREIFNFKGKGYWAFDAQEQMIHLRYRLLPYLYATSWDITTNGGSLMRPLFADYPEDKNVSDMKDEYLFGKSFLVAPIVSTEKQRKVYLPGTTNSWIDFWTGDVLSGGNEVVRNTPIDQIPVYVKAGSILPFGPTVQYAAEKPWDDLQIRIYPGADAEFLLYEDEKDNYNYEQGKYSTIRMTWNDAKKELTIHPRQGYFDGMLLERDFRIVLVDKQNGLGLDNKSCAVRMHYTGKKMKINLR